MASIPNAPAYPHEEEAESGVPLLGAMDESNVDSTRGKARDSHLDQELPPLPPTTVLPSTANQPLKPSASGPQRATSAPRDQPPQQQQQHQQLPVRPPRPPAPAHAAPHKRIPSEELDMDVPPSLSFAALGSGSGNFADEVGMGLAGAGAGAGSNGARGGEGDTEKRGMGAPFLVLTSGGATAGTRGSVLVDGPAPSVVQQRQHQQQATSAAGAPAPPQTPPKPAGYVSPSSSTSTGAHGHGQTQVQRQGSTRASDVSSSSEAVGASTSAPSRASSTWMSANASVAPLLPPTQRGGSPGPAGAVSGASTGPTAFPSPFARPGSRPNTAQLFSTASSGTFSGSGSGGTRGSMILYRLSAGEDGLLVHHTGSGSGSGTNTPHPYTPGMPYTRVPGTPGTPPGLPNSNSNTTAPPTPAWRHSTYSSSEASVFLDGDTKYPSLRGSNSLPLFSPGHTKGQGHSASPTLDSVALGMRAGTAEVGTVGRAQGGLVAYVWDPDEEDGEDEDEGEEEKWIHDPSTINPLYASSAYTSGKGSPPGGKVPYVPSTYRPPRTVSTRGIVNVVSIVALIITLLGLFIVLPIAKVYSDDGVQAKILGNTRINSTGQAVARRDVWDGPWEREV